MKHAIKHIALTGGGTGGHTYPLLAIAEELEIIPQTTKVTYLGPNKELSEKFRELGISSFHIPGSKLRRYASFTNISDILLFFLGLMKAVVYLYFIMPDILFVKGGPGSLPVALAARLFFIKIVVHESDAVPSLTTRAIAHFSSKIILSFEEAKRHFPENKVIVIGHPIRKSILDAERQNKENMKQSLGFNPANPLLFIIGGSQGAEIINDFVISNLDALLKSTQILHQTGRTHYKNIAKETAEFFKIPENRGKYQIRDYLDDVELAQALAASDLALTRAGAGTLFEISAVGLPSIIVPISQSANNHQRQNASAYAAQGGGVIIEEQNLTIHVFQSLLDKTLKDTDLQNQMSDRAKSFSKPLAAQEIAKLLANT